MIKAIIVEDDPSHSARLVNLIKKTDVPVDILAIASSVDEAATAIKEYSPELVFLDIELEGGQTAFDLLKAVNQTSFSVIFTTSHIDNNIQEIRACGISYVVKPYILEELKDALDKYLTHSSPELEEKKIRSLKSNIDAEALSEKTLWVGDRNIYLHFRIDRILYCESDNQYTHFYVLSEDGTTTSYISSYGLGQWEKDLRKYRFCRISRSHVVNVHHITQFHKSRDQILLTTGKLLDISQSGREELLKMIKAQG